MGFTIAWLQPHPQSEILALANKFNIFYFTYACNIDFLNSSNEEDT